LITSGGIYPAATSAQTGGPLAQPPAFFPQQTDFYPVAKQIAGTAAGVIWGPNVNVTYATYKDAFQKVVTAKSPFPTALDQMQQATIADMKKNGFTVSN
jgi:multiple sugar transport system substrate-binding protein